MWLDSQVSEFQFHKGTIKTQAELAKQQAKNHFNSIKVRLKHFLPKHWQSNGLFQFHKGTIKTFQSYL